MATKRKQTVKEVSRYQKAMASNSSRPQSGIRPFTSQRQQALPSRGGVPGTATRLISTASQRPGSRANVTQSQGMMFNLNVADRPMSQQGLITPKTAGRMSHRQVQDKSYYMGLLRSKITELRNEITRMAQEIDTFGKEQATFVTYEKRAETLASELKELQGELADYNLLVDKLNTDTDMDEVQDEYKELMVENQQEAESIDQMFEQRRNMEAQVKQLEAEIEKERNMADNLIAGMKPEARQKYNDLKRLNQNQQAELGELQKTTDELNARKSRLEEELSVSRVKQEAVNLLEKLRELEEKKAGLMEEEKRKGTPAQERERLLNQVKEDNAELASIERQTAEVKEQITRAQEELNQIEQDLEDQQGEKTSKYRELRKREETMDSFLNSFEETKASEENRRKQLENSIVFYLEKIGRNLAHFQNMPSPNDLAILKDDLVFKEGEMEKSRSTVGSLGQEQKKLNLDLQKIEQLESKILQELDTLKKKIKTMEEEMKVYEDLNELKKSAEDKKNNLLEQLSTLKDRNSKAKSLVAELELDHQDRKKKLNENETYVQLTSLEKKWAALEQANFAAKEIIAASAAETDYGPIRNIVKSQVADYNKLLQETLSKGAGM